MNRKEMECKTKQAISVGVNVIKRFLLVAFAIGLLGVSGCSSFVSRRDERNISFDQDDANQLVYEVVRSLATSRVFMKSNGRRNVIVVDALDVSSAADHEDVVAVGRAIDVNLRKELMGSGRFFVYEAGNRDPSASKIVPQYRFTGKLFKSAMDGGGVTLTLRVAIADVSKGLPVWSKKASVGKIVQ